MVQGGNAARSLDIENNDDTIDIHSWQGPAAANDNIEVQITGVSGEGVSATAQGNVVNLALKLGRTPPKANQTITTKRQAGSRTPPLAEVAANDNVETENGEMKTPPTLPVADDATESFDNDLETGIPKAKNTTPFAGTPRENEPASGLSLEKGDLPSDIVTTGTTQAASTNAGATTTPQQNSEVEQNQAASDLQQTRSINQARAASKDTESASEALPALFTDVAGRLPLFGSLVRLYQAAPPEGKIAILNRMQQTVSFAKLGAALTDAAEQWSAIFLPLIPLTVGLILIIALPFGVIQFVFYAVLQETAPSPLAKKFAEVKKVIDTMIASVQTKLEKKQQREQLIARQLQLRAINQVQAESEPAG